MSTPIQDRPFDGWEVVAGIRLQWLEAKDAEIKLLTVRLMQVEEQNESLSTELSTLTVCYAGVRAEADRLAIELRDARLRMEKMGVTAI